MYVLQVPDKREYSFAARVIQTGRFSWKGGAE